METIEELADWEKGDNGALIPVDDPVDVVERVNLVGTVIFTRSKSLATGKGKTTAQEPGNMVKGISVSVAVPAADGIVQEFGAGELRTTMTAKKRER